MRKWKSLLVFAVLVSTLALAGCGEKELPSASITRDDARTGGSLSFVYDKESRKVTIGGEGEVIQFSSENVEQDLNEGCRVGLKVTAPDETLDLSTATLEMNGVHYDDFLETVNGQEQRFFSLYPMFSKEDKKVKFKVKWEDKTKEQEYEVVVAKGTQFMNKNGEII